MAKLLWNVPFDFGIVLGNGHVVLLGTVVLCCKQVFVTRSCLVL